MACEVDAAQIKQVAENVLINAKEAMPTAEWWRLQLRIQQQEQISGL